MSTIKTDWIEFHNKLVDAITELLVQLGFDEESAHYVISDLNEDSFVRTEEELYSWVECHQRAQLHGRKLRCDVKNEQK